METVKVTYIGPANRRRARGKTESYWFGRNAPQRIPASDVEPVTGRDPSNWRVEWPKVQDALQTWPAPTRRTRRPDTKTAARSPHAADKPPVNEE